MNGPGVYIERDVIEIIKVGGIEQDHGTIGGDGGYIGGGSSNLQRIQPSL